MNDKLIIQHPYLATQIKDPAHYVAPLDYERLLKPYNAENHKDLDIFAQFVSKLPLLIAENRQAFNKVLELGCGPGRSTQAFLDSATAHELHLLDLSPKMLESTKARFAHLDNISYIESDTITHLERSKERYDLIYSLWSFSHSVHQILTSGDPNKGEAKVKAAMRRMIIEMMTPGAGFFVIHVDSESDEQKILFQQWKKLFPLLKMEKKQTPSKRIFDEVLEELQAEGAIDFNVRHTVMDPIHYSSLDELLDIFLNFHLESHFNTSDIVQEVINEITAYTEKFKNPDGSYSIKPGCFLYSGIKKLAHPISKSAD